MGNRRLAILGTRGIPAAHGGFETFAARLALHLVSNNWDVTVYCQETGSGPIWEDKWQGIKRIHVPVARPGALGTVFFDWRSTRHAASRESLVLTLGYNTAVFGFWYKRRRVSNLINMDGLEWQRQKWSLPEKIWLWLNERAGCVLGDHLIADHPSIAQHLATRVRENKITTIPYGGDLVQSASTEVLRELDLEPHGYALVIARPEPENSLLEIVQAFSRKKRGVKLVVLGNYRDDIAYHKEVKSLASDEVVFPGAIYEPERVQALRYYCRLYVHGHTVGGTNPSLTEALGAGNPVLAHDNRFNRWVAGRSAKFFGSADDCARQFDALLNSPDVLMRMGEQSRQRHAEEFRWELVLEAYETLLSKWSNNNTSGA